MGESKYRGIAESEGIRSVAGDMDRERFEPVHPNGNAGRPRFGEVKTVTIILVYTAFVVTIGAIVGIWGFNKMNGEKMWERARADAVAEQLAEQREGHRKLEEQWQLLVEQQQKLAADWITVGELRRDYLASIRGARAEGLAIVNAMIGQIELAIAAREELDEAFAGLAAMAETVDSDYLYDPALRRRFDAVTAAFLSAIKDDKNGDH